MWPRRGGGGAFWGEQPLLSPKYPPSLALLLLSPNTPSSRSSVALPVPPSPAVWSFPSPMYPWVLTCEQYLNYRKLELQNLREVGDMEGLRSYPKPRPFLVLTQSHLVAQISKNFADFSSEFDVFVYGGGTKPLAANVRRITEHLTTGHPLFDQENECNSQVIVVTSYDTLQARHGPSAIKKYITSLNYKPKVANRHKFMQLRDRARPDWKSPMDLSGLFDEAMLDEAQNTKGLFCTWICSLGLRALAIRSGILGKATIVAGPKNPPSCRLRLRFAHCYFASLSF